MKEKDLVVTIVVLMALFAPLVTVIAIGVGCHWLIKKGATPIK